MLLASGDAPQASVPVSQCPSPLVSVAGVTWPPPLLTDPQLAADWSLKVCSASGGYSGRIRSAGRHGADPVRSGRLVGHLARSRAENLSTSCGPSLRTWQLCRGLQQLLGLSVVVGSIHPVLAFTSEQRTRPTAQGTRYAARYLLRPSLHLQGRAERAGRGWLPHRHSAARSTRRPEGGAAYARSWSGARRGP